MRKRRPSSCKLSETAWVIENQDKHVCSCGCGILLNITRYNYYAGIPEYYVGHSPNSVAARNKYRNTVTTKGKYRNNADSFWSKVDKTSSPNGCWLWLGRLSTGYGIYTFHGRARGAHRISLFLTYGYWSDKSVCHNCPGGDNSRCVNPDHLFEGTQEDNMEDAARKGRLFRGYTGDQIMKAVELVRNGLDQGRAAKQVGITRNILSQVLNGRAWTHLTGIPKKTRSSKHGR